MSHAYYYAGDTEEGIERSLAFIEKELGLPKVGNPDVVVMRYGLLSVDDARTLGDFARQAPVTGSKKAIVISADRLFHEAQNALLKLFEEPPEGTSLFLIVPSEGIVLATLRSRMTPLPGERGKGESVLVEEFLSGTKAAREKIVAKILDRAKADKDEEKQAGRRDARALAEGLLCAAYVAQEKSASKETQLFLEDLNIFMPILHDRAAPLKPIFEHLLITLPKDLVR
jgi:hypothetical protein